MTKELSKKILFIVYVLAISVSVSACWQNKYKRDVSTYSNGIGFQYDESSDVCRELLGKSNKIEWYCPEGKIVIYILENERNLELTELMEKYFSGAGVSDNLYALSAEKSVKKADGRQIDVLVAQNSNFSNDAIDQNKTPFLIAVSPFGSGKAFIAIGTLYNAKFELSFSDAFFTIVRSFEPFTPP